MSFPEDRDSDSDTEVLSAHWLNSDLKSEHFYPQENSDRDISIDENISMIGRVTQTLPEHKDKKRKTEGAHIDLDDSLSQLISSSFLEEIKADEKSLNEEEKAVQDEWDKQLKIHKSNKFNSRGTYQEPIKTKLELSHTPRYSKHDVYYLFQYHYIEHAIDWLFLPEEPSILIELLSDQQAIYATQTLNIITEKMPESEIMPCYFAFKGMISLFVADFSQSFDYFDKASKAEDNILFMFWKIISKFYLWQQTNDYEDFAVLKLLVDKFENLSQFNVNIKWIRLKIMLYEYMYIDKTDFSLNKARDSALELKSINPYLGYIAWSEVYATTGQINKSVEVLKDCIQTEPYKVYAYIRLYYYVQKMEDPVQVFSLFLKIFLFIRETRDFVEKHSEIRYRLMTLLFVRI